MILIKNLGDVNIKNYKYFNPYIFDLWIFYYLYWQYIFGAPKNVKYEKIKLFIDVKQNKSFENSLIGETFTFNFQTSPRLFRWSSYTRDFEIDWCCVVLFHCVALLCVLACTEYRVGLAITSMIMAVDAQIK